MEVLTPAVCAQALPPYPASAADPRSPLSTPLPVLCPAARTAHEFRRLLLLIPHGVVAHTERAQMHDGNARLCRGPAAHLQLFSQKARNSLQQMVWLCSQLPGPRVVTLT